jgi:hypothetical protein
MSYDYVKALDEIERLIKRVVLDKKILAEFETTIQESRTRQTVPIRGIQAKLASYRKKYSVYEPLTDEEKVLVRDLLDEWG